MENETFTVEELIEALNEHDEKTKVRVNYGGNYFNVKNVVEQNGELILEAVLFQNNVSQNSVGGEPIDE